MPKIKKFAILIIILLVVLFVALYFSKKSVESPTILKSNENLQIEGETITYTSSDNNQKLNVLYNDTDDTATLYAGESDQVIFNATTSASGAKYENIKQGLILWNKGNNISLYLRDSLIFSGEKNN